MQMSTDDLLAAIAWDARNDAETWRSSFQSTITFQVIEAAAEDYADLRFPEHLADAETPALREVYKTVFRSTACPPGEWPWAKDEESDEEEVEDSTITPS